MPEKSLALGLLIGATVSAGLGRAFRTVEQRSRALGQTLKKAKLGAALTGDIIKYKNQLAKLKAQQQKTGASSEQLTRKIADVESKYKKATLRAGKYGIEVGNAARQHRLFNKAIERSERGLAKNERRQRNQQIRGGLKGQALGLLGGAYALGRQFSSALGFEDASVRLKTVLNAGNIGKALVQARDHAIAFARRGLTSETDILGIQYALSSAGLEAAAARAGSTVVAKVATVTAGAPEQVGEVVATVFNNLGDSLAGNTQQKLARIGDLLTKTQFKFQIRDFGQLGESLKYATPTLAQFNMDLAQGVTVIGALNSAGLQGSMAGTAFAATMRNMSKASEEFGFELVRNEKGQLDFIATMENMNDAIGGFGDMDQQTIDDLQKVFGEEGIRGVTLLGKQLGKLRTAQDDVAKSSRGLVNKSYREFVNAPSGQLKIFTNNIRLLGVTLAGSLLPTLNEILKPLIGYVQVIGKAIQDNPQLAMTIMGIVGGLFAFKAATVATKFTFTLFSDAAMFLGGALRGLKFGLGLAATAFRLLTVAVMANPIGFIVGGIAIAAGLIIANWDKVKAFFMTIWEPVKPYWEKFAAWLGKLWEKINSPFKAAFKLGRMLGNSVRGWFTDDNATGNGSTNTLSRTTTAAVLSSAIAAAPAAATNKATSVQVNAPITVQAAPGMDEDELAEQIAQRLGNAVNAGREDDRDWLD